MTNAETLSDNKRDRLYGYWQQPLNFCSLFQYLGASFPSLPIQIKYPIAQETFSWKHLERCCEASVSLLKLLTSLVLWSIGAILILGVGLNLVSILSKYARTCWLQINKLHSILYQIFRSQMYTKSFLSFVYIWKATFFTDCIKNCFFLYKNQLICLVDLTLYY